jgi:hypothetical protein
MPTAPLEIFGWADVAAAAALALILAALIAAPVELLRIWLRRFARWRRL